MAPKISVLTVVRNGEKTIKACMESVINQTYNNVEHVIVDGNSTDKTVEYIEKCGRGLINFISEKDDGIYNALNKAIKRSSGEYYIPLGCDDILKKNAIELLTKEIDGKMAVRGNVEFYDEKGRFVKLIRNHSAGILIPKKLHDSFGFYDETYRIAADTKFLKIIQKKGLICNIDDVVGEFYHGGASSNYKANISEHARAMFESGNWSGIRAKLWIALRVLYSKIK